MKVLVTGSTGLVGSSLGNELRGAGYTVCRLLRPASSPGIRRSPEGLDVNWDPITGELGAAAVGADAVVNLAGASVADSRWTSERKRLLRSSRVDMTRALVQALAKLNAPPRVLVSASGIGYYGSRGDETLDEQSTAGDDFLSDLSKDWEAEALRAEVLGARVVCLRFGVILAKDRGALPKIARPFQYGVGGSLGSGRHWMSWVAIEDVVAILRLALENKTVRGPLNVVSPQPVRNADFTSCLARVLHRPAWFPAPAFALRMVLGEMADALLLASQRVEPAYLKNLGYRFLQPDLETALRAILV